MRFEIHSFKSRAPVYLSHMPSGTSTWNLLHLSQIILPNAHHSILKFKLRWQGVASLSTWTTIHFRTFSDTDRFANRMVNNLFPKRLHRPTRSVCNSLFQATPVPYNTSNVQVPVHFFSGTSDWMATVDDVDMITTKMLRKKISMVTRGMSE